MRITVDICDNCGTESRGRETCPACGYTLGKKRKKEKKRDAQPVHPMADPYARQDTDMIQMVKVRRIIVREVPDYEAEILLRNGWERVPNPFLQNMAHPHHSK